MTQTPIDNPRRMAQISPMRTLPLVVLAVLALCGCMSRDSAWEKAYKEKRATALRNGWEPARQPVYMAPKPRFAQDNPPMVAGGSPVIMPPPIIVQAPPPPPQPSAPQPIIFTGGGNGTTIAQQVGNSTIVSQIGGWNSGTTIAQQVGGSTLVSQIGGRNSGTTIATQTDYGTVVSQFGGYRPPIGGYAPCYGQQVGFVPSW